MAFPPHFIHLARLPADPAEPRLVDIFNRITPFQDSLLSQLEIRDILSLRLATKELSDPFKTVITTQFQIDHPLEEFFKTPVQFRNLQAQYGVLITGPLALEFFSRSWRVREPVDCRVLTLRVEERY